MKRGIMSLKLINKFYHEINRKSSNLILFEHYLPEENAYILVNLIDDCYTYTCESIDYTIEHSENYKWFKLDIMH